jgi:hypothetical protein
MGRYHRRGSTLCCTCGRWPQSSPQELVPMQVSQRLESAATHWCHSVFLPFRRKMPNPEVLIWHRFKDHTGLSGISLVQSLSSKRAVLPTPMHEIYAPKHSRKSTWCILCQDSVVSCLAADLWEVGMRRPMSSRLCYAYFCWSAVPRGAAAMANLAGVRGEMGWTGGMCLPRGARAICLPKSDMTRGAGAPNRLLALRDRRGSAAYFIGLQNAPASIRARRCEPIFTPTPFWLLKGI